MSKIAKNNWYLALLFWLFTIIQTLPAKAEEPMYNPASLPSNYEITDSITEQDIPTADGGFARDYYLQLEEGDQVAIDVISDDFDALVLLLANDGSTIAENDDGPDGSTNSLLFARISEAGKYIIRVRAFGETGGGEFTLKVTRLRPIDD